MAFGSLFTGIGGLDLGLEQAGMECAWQIEWDDYCNKVLEKHWPNIRRYRDVKDCGKHNLESVDLICGGFPCQPVSTAGKRKGKEDERWLWPEFLRIIRELRPRWVLVENVPGLLSIDSGGLFGGILRDLAQSGYDAEWDCIPAAAVGAPHLRYRIFVVAYPKAVRWSSIFRDESYRVLSSVYANSDGSRFQIGQKRNSEKEINTSDGGSQRTNPSGFRDDMAHTKCKRLEGTRIFGAAPHRDEWWSVEPDVGRVAHGVPSRVDRLRCLGNAVVPQIAKWIGDRIIETQAIR